MCMTEKFWQELLKVIEAPHIAQDPRFATVSLRREHRDELTPLLDTEFERDTTAAWLAKLQGVLPAAPVYDMAQALENYILPEQKVEILQMPTSGSSSGFSPMEMAKLFKKKPNTAESPIDTWQGGPQ